VQVRSRVCYSVRVCYSFLLLQAVDLAVVEGVLEVEAAGVAAGERDNGGFVGIAGERRQAYLWCAEGRSWSGVCGERLEEGSLSGVGDGGAAAASGLPGLCGGRCALRLKKVGPTG